MIFIKEKLLDHIEIIRSKTDNNIPLPINKITDWLKAEYNISVYQMKFKDEIKNYNGFIKITHINKTNNNDYDNCKYEICLNESKGPQIIWYYFGYALGIIFEILANINNPDSEFLKLIKNQIDDSFKNDDYLPLVNDRVFKNAQWFSDRLLVPAYILGRINKSYSSLNKKITLLELSQDFQVPLSCIRRRYDDCSDLNILSAVEKLIY